MHRKEVYIPLKSLVVKCPKISLLFVNVIYAYIIVIKGGDSLKLRNVYRRLNDVLPGRITIVDLFTYSTIF